MILSTACIDEAAKRMTRLESNYEIENITKLTLINFKIKISIDRLINQSNDSLLIDLLTSIRKNHLQLDTLLYLVAQKKLIVLTSPLNIKKYAIQPVTKNNLKDLNKFFKNEIDSLKKIRHIYEVSDLNDFYDKKTEELEQNINQINNFLEYKNKSSNY